MAQGNSLRLQDYVHQDSEGKLPVLPVAEDVYAALTAAAAKEGKSMAHFATQSLRSSLAAV